MTAVEDGPSALAPVTYNGEDGIPGSCLQPDHCSYLGKRTSNGRPFSYLSLPLSLYHSAIPTNKANLCLKK